MVPRYLDTLYTGRVLQAYLVLSLTLLMLLVLFYALFFMMANGLNRNAQLERESIPFCTQIDLPEKLPVDEMDMCLVLSNLLENALEASLRASGGNRQISVEAYMHSDRLVLIQVSNSYEGEIREKQSVFRSSKRKGNGVGIQSVRRIAQKKGGGSTFAYDSSTFTAKVMLRGGGPVPPP